jgi:uncharacterized protein (DUF427 family)
MKIPGPDHPITIAVSPQRLRARLEAHEHVILADSDQALVLREANYPPVIYFPREAVEMGYAAKTQRTSHCPYKGDASYYSFHAEGEILEDVAWSYEAPYPAMQAIAGHIAFYPSRGIQIYSVSEAELAERRAEHRPAI